MKKLFTMLSIVCALFAGCSSDDTNDLPPKPELAVSSNSAAVTVDADGLGAALASDAEGLTATFDIATNLEAWSLFDPIPAWIEVTRAEKSITVKVLKNEDLQARNFDLVVSAVNKSGKLEADIRIAQAGVAPAALELSGKNLTIAAAGGSSELTFTSNQTAIDVQKTEAWLNFTQSEGKITFTAEANGTGILRTAQVTITAGAGNNKATDKVVISQDFQVTLVLSTKSPVIPAAGGTAEVTYTSNQTAIDVQKTDAWLNFTKDDGKITFAAEVNDTGAPRSAEVFVKAGTGDKAVTEKVTVSQDPHITMLSYVVKTTAANQQVGLPVLTTADSSIGISVNYGDGTAVENFTASLTSTNKHAYAAAGEYTVTITSGNKFSAFSFERNTYLRKITNNSLDMSGVTTLYKSFYNCTGLSEIAVNTLAPCVNVTSVETTFYGCTSLTAVPDGLLNGLNKITKFQNMFQGCSALASVPAGMFQGRTNVESFYGIFNGTALAEVPSKCFAGCTAVKEFKYTFHNCKNLTKINVDAFEGCTAVTDFFAVFTSCAKLTEIPADLFAKMPKLAYIGEVPGSFLFTPPKFFEITI